MKPHSARRPLDWLTGQTEFQDLSLQASRLARLQAVLDHCAPIKGLAVMALDQTVLLLRAPNASVAAKFRQFEPTVLRTLTDQGWKVSRIRVRPQLNVADSLNAARTHEPRQPVPDTAIAALSRLSEQINNARLKEAITHLLKNSIRK